MDSPTHYEVLGLAPDCTTEEVKARFRLLARKHHPDVNPNRPDSHERFIQISQAYQVLVDESRRAHYDLGLRDKARQASTARPAGPGAPPPPRTNASTPGAGARAANPGPRPQSPDGRAASLLKAAQAAVESARLKEAVGLIEATLKIDPRSAAAYELLGDIRRRQNRLDDAVSMYTVAVQLNPNSGSPMAKIRKIQERERGGFSARQRTETAAQPGSPAYRDARRRWNQQMLLATVGMCLILFLMMVYSQQPGQPLGFSLVTHWTGTLLTMLLVCGWLGGFILSMSGIIRPIDEELILPSLAAPGRGVPMGLVLGLVGLLFFWAAVVIYLIIAAMQEMFSTSILWTFAFVVMLLGGFALLSEWNGTAQQVLIWGGNVVFISMLIGWFMGDIFRPLWT